MNDFGSRLLVLVVASLSLLGCRRGVRVKTVTGPDGQPAFLIKCAATEACLKRATAECGTYEVVSRGATVSGASGNVATTTEMLIRCSGAGATDSEPASGSMSSAAPTSSERDPFKGQSPKELAGFSLGEPVDEAQSRCEERHTFKRNKSRAACSGSLGEEPLDGPVRFRICSGRVCEVELIHDPQSEDGRDWLRALKRGKEDFKLSYGEVVRTEILYPTRCHGEALYRCFVEGQAFLAYEWEWEDGVTLTLEAGPRPKRVARFQTRKAAPKDQPVRMRVVLKRSSR